ncbi:MAG TPA: diphosphate--fructose-6-phosphate 1-phosphotransferase, partial [Ruminiclostridium sp.]|nr:diphosphate--fructose-6-phosphate 1-phosphotransferase [Ruminiclostridium sp.]
EYNIGFFFYIGGNDSMDTVKKLSEYFNSIGEDIKVVGIPKTIDNDLCLTDHTPGFGSAAKFIAASTMEIAADSSVYDCTSVTIIEIMGRNAGWLTAASSLARLNGTKAPHMIYLPERAFDSKKFLLDLNELIKNERHVVVAVSEGLKLANGNYVADSEQTGLKDAFGHKYLSGIGKYLENLVMSNIGCKVRSVCLNVSQRCASHISSATDINEAFNVGSAAVDFALSGKTGVVAIIERLSNRPYSVSYEFCDVDEIANNVKFVPDNYITENGYDITDEMTEYLKPLIIGEQTKHIRNGLPVFMRINFSNHELHDKDVVILNQTLA